MADDPLTMLQFKEAIEPFTRTLDDMARSVKEGAQERKEIKRIQDKHQQFLFGNGSPGMDEDIRNIKRGIEALIKLAWVLISAIGGYAAIKLIEAFIK